MSENKRRRWLAVPVILILLSLFALSTFRLYQDEITNAKHHAYSQAMSVGKNLETLISDQLYQEQGIEAYMLSHSELSTEEINAYIAQLYRYKQPVFRSLALLKNTTVTYVYPTNGNQGAIGVDLSTIEAQKQDVLYVKSTLNKRIAAPVNLVQGGRGIIIRCPLFSLENGSEKKYLGQISLVLDYDAVSSKSELDVFMQQYQVMVTEKQPGQADDKLIFGNVRQFDRSPEQISIQLPTTTWQFAFYPKDGWAPMSSTWVLFSLGGTFLTLLIGFFIWRLFNYQDKLNDTVAERTKDLFRTNEYLEQTLAEVEEKQAELYIVNDLLEQSVDDLKSTQDQLIQSEKFAALGELVAGVAHEINTPLGIGITLASYVENQHAHLKRQFYSGQLSKGQLNEYIEGIEESLGTMVSSLNRSAEIISSFKNVAGEQSILELRQVNMYQFLQDVLNNLKPKLKQTNHSLHLNCPKDLVLYQYPGAFSHIITNLVVNSLTHGFEDMTQGEIYITLKTHQRTGILIYEDNGKGISDEHLTKVFDPFYTTKRGQGNTGLGMHIVHNIVTQTLKGKLQLITAPGEGLKLIIDFPLIQPENEGFWTGEAPVK